MARKSYGRYVSFDEVKMRVGMEQTLEHYGLLDAHTKRKGDELTMHCVFHDNDTTPSLKINTAKNIFNQEIPRSLLRGYLEQRIFMV